LLCFTEGAGAPYCNLELRAWQQLLLQIKALDAQLIAISPQTPDNSLSTVEKNALAFEVLSDSSLVAARAFGIEFDMPKELVDLYTSVGHDLAKTNDNGRWALPVPATYVVGRDGVIQYANIDADYRDRAEPSEVLAALIKRSKTAAAR
jgi:peroxiredoxin